MSTRARFIFAAVAACALIAPQVPVLAQSATAPIDGVWYLTRERSDLRPPQDDSAPQGRGRFGGGAGGGRGRGGTGGGLGRGGFGGGMGPRGGGPGARDPEEMRRRFEAMRGILEPAERLTIVRTESMVIVTSDRGLTTRLAPDGSKVKDASTGIERRTRWESAKLVSEISGAGPGRITETYSLDPESKRLFVDLRMEGGRGGAEPRTVRRVYEKDE